MTQLHIPGFALALALPLLAAAQAPTAYSVTQVTSMMGPSMTQKIYRDGSKALIENLMTGENGAAGGRPRTLYDLANGKAVTWDADQPAEPCSSGQFKGDWGDPFKGSDDTKAELAKSGAKDGGTETLNGAPARVFLVSNNEGAFKAWVDNKSGLVMKLEATTAGKTITIVEIKEVTLAKPPASLFVLPPACTAEGNAPPPPGDGERFAAETGGAPGDFLNANTPPDPSSKSSCTLLFRAVAAGSMKTITGYKVSVDDADKTAQLKNGVLRIENAPEHFNLSLNFADGGSFGTIYRQCPLPETVLLLVIKDPANVGKGADWMFVRSGKFAR